MPTIIIRQKLEMDTIKENPSVSKYICISSIETKYDDILVLYWCNEGLSRTALQQIG